MASLTSPAKSFPAIVRVHRSRPPLLGWLTGLPVACLLLASAIAHIGNPYQFLAAVQEYQLIPTAGAQLVAALLPFLHITLALCLITGQARRPAFRLGFVLFLLYAAMQATTLVRGLKVDCGCFGPSETSNAIGVRSIAIAVSSALVCLFGVWAARVETGTQEMP